MPKKYLLPILLFSIQAGTAAAQNADGIDDKKAIALKSSIDLLPVERWNLHFQATYVYQYKPGFHAPYSGINSLSKKEEKQNSLTTTLYFGTRLWKGASIYINPEVAGGSGLSGALGMAGSSNGETFRVGDPSPTFYLARGYFKQVFALSGSRDMVPGDANQLAGTEPQKQISISIGKLSLGDIFDNNEYSNSPRTQFMNWALMNNGAWDYAANVRGYTYAGVVQLETPQMGYRLAIATVPTTANGAELNTDLGKAYSLNAEIARSYAINGKKGNIRLLGYRNNANMGRYTTAVAMAADTPDIASTRKYGRVKYGLGLNFDQQLGSSLGIFARAGWNDGKTETWAFTEIDRTVSLGLSMKGRGWRRPYDEVGIAFAGNGLSQEHRNYLRHGGSGFMLGDGNLNYAPEMIGEVYYSCKPVRTGIWLSADYQYAINPGYNSDRGPVHIFSARVHVEL